MSHDELIARAESEADDLRVCERFSRHAMELTADVIDDLIAALRAERKARERAEARAEKGFALADVAAAVADGIRQEAADEALERAAEAADYIQNKYWRPVRVFRTETETAIDDGKRDCAEEVAAAIRALKGGAK